MKKNAAEPYREIDFSRAKRGRVVAPLPGKTRISISLDTAVLHYFRVQIERAGGGNLQTTINDALISYIGQRSIIDTIREVVREELRKAG